MPLWRATPGPTSPISRRPPLGDSGRRCFSQRAAQCAISTRRPQVHASWECHSGLGRSPYLPPMVVSDLFAGAVARMKADEVPQFLRTISVFEANGVLDSPT